MDECYQDNISTINTNWNKLSQLHNDLIEYRKLPSNTVENKGNVAQFINPNMPNKDINIKYLKNSDNDYEKFIYKILLDTYNEIGIKSILDDILVLSNEIKENYKCNTDQKIRINKILISEYNKLINKLHLFDNESIKLIYGEFKKHIIKGKYFKNFDKPTQILFSFTIKQILINLEVLNIVEVYIKKKYPNTKDKNRQIKSLINKIEDIKNSGIINELIESELNNLSFNLSRKINTTLKQQILLSSYEIQELLKHNNVNVTKKNSQILYNEVLKKFINDYEIKFMELNELTDLFH